jgi:PAS domain S-box-containing protein
LKAKGNAGGRQADASKAPTHSDPQSLDQREHRPSLYLLLLFLVLAAGIITAGYLFYRSYARNFRGEVERGLSSIAELKVGQLVQWRKERLADASVFYRNRAFSGLVERLLKTPADTDVRGRILSWLDRVQDAYRYDRVFILDAQGIERLAVPGTPEPVASHLLQQIPEILRSNKITFLDFHRDTPDRPIHLSLVVPVRLESDGGRPLGVLVLRIDPTVDLYPFIQQWPSPSRTAETLLVRREGDEALFLNELRFRKNSALSLRVPLDKGDVPAVKAALGQEGIVEGVDYRGVPVVADVRGISDSPWFMVARIDTTEVNAPLRERSWLLIGLVAALLFGTGAGVGLIWHQQRLRFFRERLAAVKRIYTVSSRQEALLSAVPDIIMEVDQNKVYTWANPAGVEFFGEDVVGKEAAFYFEGEHETYQKVKPLFQGHDDVIHVESWQRRKDGEKRLLAWWCRMLKDDSGRVTGALSSARDITERKRAEEALRESEEKYRAIIETNQEWIWQIDNEGIHTYSNPAIEQILGYSIEDIVGKNATIHMHPEDRREIKEMLPKWIENKKGWKNLVVRWLHKDGSIRWLESNAVAMLDVHGEWIGFQGSDRDITERKRADEAVRKSEEKYKGLTENVNLGIYRNTVGPEGKFIEANPALVAMFGYKSKEEFLAINVSDLYQDAEGRKKFNDKMLQEGFVRGEELWLKKEDGSLFIASVSAVAVKDEQGHVKYYDGIIDDITERKRAEEALRASLREKEVLLREVHHRVKNNMQVISSLFNLQAGYTTNEECRGILKEGQARIRSMSLVHEKLYQSRDMSKIDLADYIQGLAAHLFHVYLVNPAQVRMETEFEDVSVDINSAVPCGLILNELISNALKHAFPEGRTGVIKIGMRRGPGGAAELRVADDGVGFPEGLDFRKAESFGLQIVNLLVDQLEAAIDLDRTKGTAFTMTFRELKYAPRA